MKIEKEKRIQSTAIIPVETKDKEFDTFMNIYKIALKQVVEEMQRNKSKT